jgi:hypothetical protein
MIRIKLTTSFPELPLLRQTPGGKGIWGDCRFFVNQDIDECDFWVVYEGLLKPERTVCPNGNTILVTGESPGVKRYNEKFLMQFAKVITCHNELKHSNTIISQQGNPWMVGGRFLGDGFDESFSKDYDELKSINKHYKSKLISLIISSKTYTEGHARRFQFVKKLKAHFGDKLDVFGVGIKEIEDKWDAIAKYKYHIVLENTSHHDYWTEKLSDAFLGGAYPFYYGCPNLSDYFSADAFTFIDIDDLDKSIATIENEIKNQKYEGSIEKIAEAKDLILDKYNIFPLISNYCKSGISSPANIILKPENQFIQNASIVVGFSKLLNRLLRG